MAVFKNIYSRDTKTAVCGDKSRKQYRNDCKSLPIGQPLIIIDYVMNEDSNSTQLVYYSIHGGFIGIFLCLGHLNLQRSRRTE